MAENLIGMLIGRKLLGLCSCLFVDLDYPHPAAAQASMQAWLTNKLGSILLLAGFGFVGVSYKLNRFDLSTIVSLTASGIFHKAQCFVAGRSILLEIFTKLSQFYFFDWLPNVKTSTTRKLFYTCFEWASSFLTEDDLECFDILDSPLPLFHEGSRHGDRIKEIFQRSDTVVAFFQEYNGSLPAATKNIFDYLSYEETRNKPFFLSCCTGGVRSTSACNQMVTCIHKLGGIVFPRFFILSHAREMRNCDIQLSDDLIERLNSFFNFARKVVEK